jgi:transcriptional antiterminator
MKVSKRQSLILNYLNEYQNISLKQAARKFTITTATVKNEITLINEILINYDTQLEIQQNNIIKIINKEKFIFFLKEVQALIEFPIQNQILMTILLEKDFITIQEIADKLFVSKSLVEKQMSSILKNYKEDIQSIRHYGIRYSSSSKLERMSLFVKLLLPYVKGIDFSEEVNRFNNLHFNIADYFIVGETDICISVIDYIKEINLFTFTDESIKQLFLYLLFLLKDIREQNTHKENKSFIDLIKDLPNFKKYFEIVSEINEKFNLYLKEEDKYHLCYLFSVLKKNNVLNKSEKIEKLKPTINRILSRIKTELSINLFMDEQLKKGLSLHLYSTINRGEYSVLSEIYSLSDIKKLYPFAFEMSTITADVINEDYKYSFLNNELIYLSLHFQTAIERAKSKKDKLRVLIVCHLGQVSTDLIVNRIKNIYKDIEIVGAYSVQKFLKAKKDCYDFIISTEKLPNQSKDIIYVSPLIKDQDQENIETYIKRSKSKKLFEELLERGEFLEIEDAKNYEDAIKEMVEVFRRNSSVDNKYLESVLDREKLSTTNINNIAIPHGKASHVLESSICIAYIKNGVNWGDTIVYHVFLIAFDNVLLEQNSEFFNNFYRKVAQIDSEEAIENMDSIDRNKLIELMY